MSGRRGKLVPLDDVTVAHYYTRVSGDEQWEEGLSLGQQPERCEQYIGRLPKTIIGEHFQDVLSGRKDNRKDYQRMLMTIRGLAMEGRRQILVIPAFDRFGRNIEERVRAYKELQSLGVPLHGIRESGVVPEFVYNILAAAAQEESRQLGVRLREINDGLAAKGWPKPGKTAWGFDRRPATAEERAGGSPKTLLQLHEIEATSVREAWERYADGASIRSIAIWASGLPAVARGGRNLGFNAIRQAFRAPIYVARLGAYDDDDPASILDRPVAQVPRMVDDDLWLRAVRSRDLAQRVPRQASGAYRLTGLLYCWKCGARMSGRHKPAQSGWNKAARYEYICNSGKVLGAAIGGARCSSTVLLDQLEGYVLGLVRAVLDAASQSRGHDALSTAWEQLNRGERGSSAAGRIAALERKREQAAGRQVDASAMFVAKELTREQYDPLYAKHQQDIDTLDEEIRRLRGMVRPTALPMQLEPLLRSLTGWRTALESENIPAVRAALAVLLTRVTPVRVRRGAYVADLEWTPIGTWLLAVAAAVSQDPRLVSVYHMAKALWSTGTTLPTTAAG